MRQTLNETSLICTPGFDGEHTGHCHRAERIYQRPMGNSAHWRSPRSHRTALRSRQRLGSAEVTHPFHPLRGQKFVVLKLRTVSGVPTLSVRHPDLGSFAIPEDWTDWSASAPPSSQSLVLDAFGLAELAAIVESISRGSKKA